MIERISRRRRIANGRLRWGIRIAAPEGPGGDRYGDVAFADDLAAALRRAGQTVHIDRLHSRHRPRDTWRDDVVLAVRGLVELPPEPGVLNYLWVISHPEAVSDQELRAGWGRRYAASLSWGAQRGSEAAVHIEPLLQAVAAERFRPGPPVPGREHDVLFVGTSRLVHRPVVMDAASLGVDLRVYGHDWEQFIDERYIAAQFLPFAEVPAVYRSARRVLNDHWEDMRAAGFISNRLFDAVASGARVVSDRVEGLDAVFHGAVRTYDSREELARLLADDAGWPDAEAGHRIADAVRDAHSFDARAAQLLDGALHDYRSRQLRLTSVARRIARALLLRLRSRATAALPGHPRPWSKDDAR